MSGAIVAQLLSYDDAGEKIVVGRRASSPSGPCTCYDACTSSGNARGSQAEAARPANCDPHEQPDAASSPVVLIDAF
jgi:hypothetical protein